MSFIPNSSQQISLFDSLGFLSLRKQRMLNSSWAQAFSDHVFGHINEQIFAPLYSEQRNSRPNAPINVIVGALILKDFTGQTDDEMLESCEFDLRYQYALHTTSFEEQPLSDRTFSRFRERCAAYELTTGTDLIHECFSSLAESMREFMDISPNIKRMDSMMIESNIRRMGRLELLYTCLSNLVKRINKDGRKDLMSGLEHYADQDDRNRVVYHDSSVPQSERIQKVIDDASSLLPKCASDYSGTDDYQLLERAIREQTKKDGDGKNISRTKEDAMDSSILQNPADPDATYREKAGKKHRGYAANLTEAADKNGSVITEYQYDVNTRSDNDFLKEYIESSEPGDETTAVIADGAYSSQELALMAATKNIGILTTGLLGRKPRPILTRFILTDKGHGISSCPNGNQPKSCSYIRQSDSIRVSFLKEQCEGCPYRDECNPALRKRTAVLLIPLNARARAWDAICRKGDKVMQLAGRYRNGVETLPSTLRSKYHVDRMPVRGKLKTKQFFGFKVAALNFSKLLRHTRGLGKCRTFQTES